MVCLEGQDNKLTSIPDLSSTGYMPNRVFRFNPFWEHHNKYKGLVVTGSHKRELSIPQDKICRRSI